MKKCPNCSSKKILRKTVFSNAYKCQNCSSHLKLVEMDNHSRLLRYIIGLNFFSIIGAKFLGAKTGVMIVLVLVLLSIVLAFFFFQKGAVYIVENEIDKRTRNDGTN